MNVRAKFKCIDIKENEGSKSVTMWVVIDGSEENKSFAKYTPSGQLQILIDNETPAANAFELYKEYYLDISPAQ